MNHPNPAPGFHVPTDLDRSARVPNRQLPDLAATWALGEELAQRLPAGAVLLLRGELGAGKTSLVQGLAKGLGIHETVTSPSFALAHHYTGKRANGTATALVHIDLYRLEDPASADELFAQEEEEAQALGAWLVVEWPERLPEPPSGAWQLVLEHRLEGRQAVLVPPRQS